MMSMKTSTESLSLQVNGGNAGVEKEWELRPGGMLVQKREESENHSAPPPPTIRVRVKYGSVYHEIFISSQATFGELKKMLSVPTGLQHQDQKLFYKKKERDSCAFLDTAGVKNKSKLILIEDPISQEKRYIVMSKNAKMERASKSISTISMEVDRLASEVSLLETIVSRGGRIVEKDVVSLIESLMNQLLKLDAIVADGDVKLQRKMQVMRVQKYVETLDVLKLKNSSPAAPISSHHSNGNHSPLSRDNSLGNSFIMDSPMQQQQPVSRHSSSTAPVVITTQWETFDSFPVPVTIPAKNKNQPTGIQQPSFPWDLL